ncbi:hypothetical protein B0H16DRAFT_789334 [Mycena metata]|uniref:Uncharacterized protein n=1 Tax=Mycena metata TaxID=1033252 RepID=A0AAD7NBF1_9AGAR|nr:hypothetical protein B0H16DRAFT_789334 [Mycena metata]
MGVEVVRHTPAVGAHLQDHIFVTTIYNCPLSDSLWAMIRRPQTLISQICMYIFRGSCAPRWRWKFSEWLHLLTPMGSRRT